MGYTTYVTIIIRANQDTPINENAPKNFTEFLSYLNREQYGDFPTFKRRFSQDANQQGIYDTSRYATDLSFVWKYQMNHMMTRYILWTYGGRSSWYQDAGANVWPFNDIANFIGKIFYLKFEGDSHNSFFGIPFLIGLLGIYFHFRKDWKMATAFLILFFFTTYLFAFYQNQQEPQPRERDKFYAAGGFAFAIWIGIAVQSLVDLVKQKAKTASLARSLSWVVIFIAIIFIPARMLQANYSEHDRSRNWIPWDLAYNLLQSCAPNAILFTNGDNDTFPLWYLQEVEGVRTDIRIVNLSLGNTPWYVSQLKNLQPHGALKVKMSFPDEVLTDETFRPVPWEPTMDTILIPKDFDKKSVNYNNYAGLSEKAKALLKDEYVVKDSSVIREGRITWLLKNTVSYQNVKALRVQDILVKDIVEQNAWERPIYFAVTCSEDCKIGLGDYLKMEGLAYRLVPEKRPAGATETINENVLRTQLFDLNPGFSKVYEPGFKFRGLNDKTIFLDDNQERLVQNYRNSFFRLALYYFNIQQNAKATETLDNMEKLMPRENIRMDFRLMYEMSRLYSLAGNPQKSAELQRDVVVEANKSLKETPDDPTPYQVLIRMYEENKDYDNLLLLFNRLKMTYPNDPSIDKSIQHYKAMKAAADTAKK
jgi:tetratricopeptide (TPR) repeat protein